MQDYRRGKMRSRFPSAAKPSPKPVPTGLLGLALCFGFPQRELVRHDSQELLTVLCQERPVALLNH